VNLTNVNFKHYHEISTFILPWRVQASILAGLNHQLGAEIHSLTFKCKRLSFACHKLDL